MYVPIKGRNEYFHTGECQQDSVILNRVVRTSHHAVTIPAAIPYKHDGKSVHANVISDLLKGAGKNKRSDTVNPRPEVLARQSGRHRHHILLSNARIDKSRAYRLLQRFKSAVTQITSQKDKVFTRLVPQKGITKGLSHKSPSSSRAILY